MKHKKQRKQMCNNLVNESGGTKKREAINVRILCGSASTPASSSSARSGSMGGNNNSDNSCSSNDNSYSSKRRGISRMIIMIMKTKEE